MQEKFSRKLRVLSFVGSLIGIACLVLLSYFCIRLAWADLLFRTKKLPSVLQAIRMAPSNAQYQVALAELQESEGGNPDEALRRATALNPLDSFAWMRRGFRAESAGDFTSAERFLLAAARVDRQFDPRWALMNYYFRRGALPQFWSWTRKSLERGYGDLTPIFRLCWKVTQDAAEVRRALPPGAPVLAAFTDFLLAEGRVEPAAFAAVELASYGRPGDLPLLLSSCERALEEHRIPSALALWNAMCDRKLVPGPRLEPARGTILTNGKFTSAPLGKGFEWHLSNEPEITAAQTDSGFKISLSGRQPEACEIVWQYVPLSPGQRYRFRYEFETAGAAPQSGLRWRLSPLPANGTVLFESAWLAGDEKQRQDLTFSSLSTGLGRLALTYRRAPGTTRLEGSVTLANLALEPVP